ncbi:PREDICTED: chromatin structure-remodeling complex protein SYD isoform X2 [Nelumbo nucifera]|uniref:Chromatin structure-remodeling complex protein SYD isoform X2 n=2 Tax=Nelumbo nucifera TaxID=4432 RepID=A0A1U7Z815_NELNU|nr:PREDICTED: chromatin structure-remodeling complex protein SYD isoform X2 [Nelumbo nucifera]DAD37920.1 TPA_asm: hypothetical protein HUJ06_008561 [Nelumbo nucifera]
MASSHHVEMEAAKFLHKLIQESKDEPAKLATKLYVICQHMKLSGKEHSLPYQVISRAMETVINQHGIDIEALKSSRLPLAGGTQIGDPGNSKVMEKETTDNTPSIGASDVSFRSGTSSAWHPGSSSKTKEVVYGGSSQGVGALKDSKTSLVDNEIPKHEATILNRPPVGPSRMENVGHDLHQGSLSQRSAKLFDHESPSSMDTRSGNSQERRDTAMLDKQGLQKDTKKGSSKRKRADSTSSVEAHTDYAQQLDTSSAGFTPRKGKPMNKGDLDPSQNSSHGEHLSPLSGGMGSVFRAKQENQNLHDILSSRGLWNQSKGGLQSENSHGSRISPNVVPSSTGEISMSHLSTPSLAGSKEAVNSRNEQKHNIYDSKLSENQTFDYSAQSSEHGGPGRPPGPINSSILQGATAISGGCGKVHGGMPGAFSSYAMAKQGLSPPIQFNNSSFDGHDLASKLHKERSIDTASVSQLAQRSNDRMSIETSMKGPAMDISSKYFVDSEHRKHGFMKDEMPSTSEKGVEAQLFSATRGEETSTSLSAGKVVEQDGGISHTPSNISKMVQGAESNSNVEMISVRSGAPRNTGKILVHESPASSSMPFKEQHLKQLRAQCLVFLAFRNGLVPKKVHLDYALGGITPKEGVSVDGARRELNDARGKELSSKEPTGNNEVGAASGRSNDIRETERVAPGSSSTGSLIETDSLSKDMENQMMVKGKKGPPSDWAAFAEERKRLLAARRKTEAEMQTQEVAESQGAVSMILESDSARNGGRFSAENNHEKGDPDNSHRLFGRANQISSSVLGVNRQQKPEITSWTGIGSHNEAPRATLTSSAVLHEQLSERVDISLNQSQIPVNGDRVNKFLKADSPVMQTNQHADKYASAFPLKEQIKPFSGKDIEPQTTMPLKDVSQLSSHVLQGENATSKMEPVVFNSFMDSSVSGGNSCTSDQRVSEGQMQRTLEVCKMVTPNETLKYGNSVTMLDKSTELEDDENLSSADMPPSPKYTTSEKWITDQQKRKLLEEQTWALKQRKMEEKISACVDKLKETVSSSEDISAKTKSVIELKKLQLLELQRRLRSDFLHDFFKPIASDMERLKSIKKHRHGRRLKQLEKFEQKMKEERQKRIRERQKEFFSEIEVHKERMEDWFKIKRERWKGFNKYVKEFHKRKERIHREKIDRIQREKINLLKNNDVEGYLRMVQDAKSDRVKQLLKETEKYLQKLGAKLQDAKAMARRFEMEMEENRAANVVEKNEIPADNEDESDQAQHYLESNEKYYMMAHSVKESIAEQPTCLQGGKLREYQMNGLRWLVSLYNNNLNGILADEMGLGKTVQVIALICYLMETKNDRGPFLVVVPSSVLPGWESELSFWAPGINKIAYAGPPEERRRLFKDMIVHQKFNVLLTTYEYLMNKHDRPKLSKIQWHYIIIDEGHRIKNASCKLNADLRHYQSYHKLLLTGTPLQNNLDELWALLNFLLPNIFNSSEDFSQWFNKPFESSGDNSPDEALLSEEENLLIINRLHQVLRPFVLRRLKHKVENELPEKIERLVRCEASAYQKLLMKRVEDNLGSIGNSKGRSVHNSVMELRNICNHPYLSQLHADEVDSFIPKHYLPPIVRLCGKLEMLDRLLPKLKATDHRVLFFSTMTRLLDVMEEYLHWKRYKYLRLDGHTSGNERGALIEEFNRPDSPAFIFLLSIRAGGVGVNLQAADTVIIFDTDWNPQVDLQAQARAHRIGQKRDVLVLRLETVRTVEEQVRAAAEHKLGVANQSITAGFFDNNTSAEDRREYLESLLRECKKEEVAPVLDDDALNDLLARSESELDVFESVDRQRREEEMAAWKNLVQEQDKDCSESLPPMPPRLVTDDDLLTFYKAMQIFDASNVPAKRKSEYLGGLDTQQYGRGKRAREVRSYEDQWTEEEFEKMCQVDSPESPKPKEEIIEGNVATETSGSKAVVGTTEPLTSVPPPPPSTEQPQVPGKEQPPASRRGRGRPKRATADISVSPGIVSTPESTSKLNMGQKTVVPSSTATLTPDGSVPFSTTTAIPDGSISSSTVTPASGGSILSSTPAPVCDSFPGSVTVRSLSGTTQPGLSLSTAPGSLITTPIPSAPMPIKGQNRKTQSGSEAPRRRAKKQTSGSSSVGPDISPISRMPKETSLATDSSLTSFTQEKQKAASRSPAITNPPAVVGPETNPISRIPKDISMVSESYPNSTFAIPNVVSRPPGTSNTATIVSFEVNPISGLQKLVELVPVRTTIPTFVQDKYTSVVPGLDKKETESKVEKKPNSIGATTTTARKDSVEPRKNDGLKGSMLYAGQEHKVDQTSAPVVSTLAQDLRERRSLRMGSIDHQKSTEKPESASALSVQKTVPVSDASKVATSGNIRGDGDKTLGHPTVKPVGFATGQGNIHTANASSLSTQDTRREIPSIPAPLRQTKSSAEKDKCKSSVPAKRGSRKKDLSAPNNKPAAVVMNDASNIIETIPTAHSTLVGPLVAESNRSTKKASTVRDKQDITAKKMRSVAPDVACQTNSLVVVSDQKPSATDKLELSSQTSQQVGPSVLQENIPMSIERNSAAIEASGPGNVTPEKDKISPPDVPTDKSATSTENSNISAQDKQLTQSAVGRNSSAREASGPGNVTPEQDKKITPLEVPTDKSATSTEKSNISSQDKQLTQSAVERNSSAGEASGPGNVTPEQDKKISPPAVVTDQKLKSTEKSNISAQDKQISRSAEDVNAANPICKSVACIELSDVKSSSASEDGSLPSQVEFSQKPAAFVLQSGETQSSGINDAASVREVGICSSETTIVLGGKDGALTLSPVSNLPNEKLENPSAEINAAKAVQDKTNVLVILESTCKDASALLGDMTVNNIPKESPHLKSSNVVPEAIVEGKVSEYEDLSISGPVKKLTDSEKPIESKSLVEERGEINSDLVTEGVSNVSCTGASSVKMGKNLESNDSDGSQLTENNANNAKCDIEEPLQSAETSAAGLQLAESSCPAGLIAVETPLSEVLVGSTETCNRNDAENASVVIQPNMQVVLEDQNKTGNKNSEVEETVISDVGVVSGSNLSESVLVSFHKNRSAPGVTECASKEPEKNLAVDEVVVTRLVADICTVPKNSEKTEVCTVLGQNKVPDPPMTASTASTGVQLPQSCEQIPISSIAHGVPEDSVASMISEKADDNKKHEGAAALIEGKNPDEHDLASVFTVQVPQQMEQVPNPWNPPESSDLKKHDSVTTLGKVEADDIPNTSLVSEHCQGRISDDNPSASSTVQVSLADEQVPCSFTPGENTGSGETDNLKKHDSTTGLGQIKTDDLPNVAQSPTVKIPQPDELVPDPSINGSSAIAGEIDALKKHDNSTGMSQGKISDENNLPPAFTVEVIEADKQVPSLNVHGANADAGNREETDNLKKHDTATGMSQVEANSLPSTDLATGFSQGKSPDPVPSLTTQIIYPDEQVPPSSTYVASVDVGASMNPGDTVDLKKHDSSTTLGQNEAIDLPNTAFTLSTSGQISQLEEQVPCPLSTHVATSDAVVSMNSENLEIGDHSEEPINNSIPSKNEVTKDEQNTCPSMSHDTGPSNVLLIDSESPDKRDHFEKPNVTCVPGQSESSDLPDTANATSLSAQDPQPDQKILRVGTCIADAEGSVTSEQAHGSTGVGSSIGQCGYTVPYCADDVALHAVSADNKLDDNALHSTKVNNEVIQDLANPTVAGQGEDILDVALPDHNTNANTNNFHGHTSGLTDRTEVCSEKADGTGDHPGIVPTRFASAQCNDIDDRNLETPCATREDETHVSVDVNPDAIVGSAKDTNKVYSLETQASADQDPPDLSKHHEAVDVQNNSVAEDGQIGHSQTSGLEEEKESTVSKTDECDPMNVDNLAVVQENETPAVSKAENEDLLDASLNSVVNEKEAPVLHLESSSSLPGLEDDKMANMSEKIDMMDASQITGIEEKEAQAVSKDDKEDKMDASLTSGVDEKEAPASDMESKFPGVEDEKMDGMCEKADPIPMDTCSIIGIKEQEAPDISKDDNSDQISRMNGNEAAVVSKDDEGDKLDSSLDSRMDVKALDVSKDDKNDQMDAFLDGAMDEKGRASNTDPSLSPLPSIEDEKIDGTSENVKIESSGVLAGSE